MAKSDEANTPTGQERSLFLLLREAGDALEAASPPFDAAAGAARLRKTAWAHGLLRPDDVPPEDLAVTGASLEEEAPPFDVDAGAARLRKAAHARGLLSGSASEASTEAASRHSLRVVRATSPPGTEVSVEEIGYRVPTVCAAAKISYNQLDYWARTGLIEPSVRAAHGPSTKSLYSFRDILVLKVVKRLLDTGISLQQIRTTVQHLRDSGTEDLARIRLMSDGSNVYECTSAEEALDLVRADHAVSGIALGRIWREVEADLAALPTGEAAPDPNAHAGAPELPKYNQGERQLLEFIATLDPGSPVPPERELTRAFRISRIKLRQAFTVLVIEGWLRIQGKDTFVAEAERGDLDETYRILRALTDARFRSAKRLAQLRQGEKRSDRTGSA